MATETKTFYPGAHEGFSGNEIRNATNPVGKGSSNTTYADVNAASKGTAYCYWPFDVSAIPENATIDSVSCVVGVMVNNGAAPFTGNIQLYSGSTAKGTASSLSYSSSKKIITLSVGTWTRAELNGIRLRTYLKNNGSFAFSLSFFGADLAVTYTYQGQKFMLKLSGSYHDIARAFQKIDSIWIEQDDLNNVVVSENGLVNGGEIESTGPALITFSIAGTSYQAEEGMTAEEWVASSYNTDGCLIVNYYGTLCLTTSNSRRVLRTDGSNVVSTDVLVSGDAYTIN